LRHLGDGEEVSSNRVQDEVFNYREAFIKTYDKEPTVEELRVFTKYIDLVKHHRVINP
jgi:hypothetical protein